MIKASAYLSTIAALLCCSSCASPSHSQAQTALSPDSVVAPPASLGAQQTGNVQLASHQQVQTFPEPAAPPQAGMRGFAGVATEPVETLEDLEIAALTNNPLLRRMQQEAAAAGAKTGYVSKLPDPTISSMFYIPPMRLDPDRQLSELQVMQMIPWLSRLKAEAQEAYFEALVAENQYHAERLRVVGDLRATWFRLYVLAKQIETTHAEQAQLESLIKTANARIATGHAQPGDVLMATLELSSLQEELLSYRQQVASSQAEINRLVGRDSQTPISTPGAINVTLPEWNHELLRSAAMTLQPELNAARLRTEATRWGIEVARLKRRPDLTVSGGWIAMDAPGAMMPGAGADTWTVGVSSTLPIWHRKYEAMVSEASSEHCAAHASVDEVALRLDATLRDLWEQARAAQQTVALYQKTILPQARQTFDADLKSLANNTVTFDRVIRDYRTLLTLELGYHRALGQLATTLARIQQTVGSDLPSESEPLHSAQ
jgi:outer membrane protein TolC